MRTIILFLALFSCIYAQDKIEIKRTYYETGELSSETRYVNGKKDGLSLQFYPNGQIRRKNIYDNGKQVIFEGYREDGSQSAYFDMQQENISTYKFINEDGTTSMSHEVHKDPQDKKKYTIYLHENDYTLKVVEKDNYELEAPAVKFKDDPNRQDGRVVEYNDDGSPIYEANVKDGYIDGEVKFDYGYSSGIANYSNGKINGKQTKYKEGMLQREIEYKDNQKSGIWREYYSDGALKHEGVYEKDKLIGEFIEYREDGTIKSKMRFDKKDRTIRQEYDKNGNVIQIVHFNGNYSLDLSDLNKTTLYQQTLLYPNGKLYREFNRSKKGDRLMIYYPSGELKFTIPYTQHKAHGEAKKFYKNGKLRARIPMVKNKIDGTIRIYYPNGNSLKYTLPYKKNRLSGTKIRYDRLTQKVDYNISYSKDVIDLSKPYAFKTLDCNTLSYYENRKLEHNISCTKESKKLTGYYSNGMIECEINYKKNKKEGLSYLYYGIKEFDELTHLGELRAPIIENTIHQEITFANDQLNGITSIYDVQGEISKKISYKNNLREGTTTEYGVSRSDKKPTKTQTEYKNDKKDGIERYYKEGELKRETTYKDGKKDGRQMKKEWSSKTITYYKNGKKEGFETQYNKDEKIIDGKEYNNGKIVYEIEEITYE